jgi:hypothetical protein
MQTEPPNADPPKRKRRWFQFSLRTLMIVVTLFCVVVGGYVGWQAKIVRERKATAREVTGLGGMMYSATRVTRFGPDAEFSMGDRFFKPPYPSVSFLRRWLGDDWVVGIVLPRSTSAEMEKKVIAAFPEAVVRLRLSD